MPVVRKPKFSIVVSGKCSKIKTFREPKGILFPTCSIQVTKNKWVETTHFQSRVFKNFTFVLLLLPLNYRLQNTSFFCGDEFCILYLIIRWICPAGELARNKSIILANSRKFLKRSSKAEKERRIQRTIQKSRCWPLLCFLFFLFYAVNFTLFLHNPQQHNKQSHFFITFNFPKL